EWRKGCHSREADVTGPSRRGAGALGEPAVSLLQPWQQLREVHRPSDAHHPVGKDAVVVGIPVAFLEPLQGRKAEVIRDAGNPTVPASLALRLAQLLGDGSQREKENRRPEQTAETHGSAGLATLEAQVRKIVSKILHGLRVDPVIQGSLGK